MFNNCGPKIKMIANVFFILGAISSFVGGVILLDEADEGLGIAVMLGGILVSYIMSLMLATFGEIAENTSIIAKNTQNQSTAPAAAAQQPAVPVCPSCGKPYAAGSKFCTGCGTPL